MSLAEYQKQCLDKLIWATQTLGVKADDGQLDQIAILIVETMTGPWRYFHTPHHIFQVGGYDDPIEVLAALFHDVVYVQVDQCVHFNLAHYITPFAKYVEGHLVVRSAGELPEDKTFELVSAIFEIIPGQKLSPFAGQNEFLSSIVAAKILEPIFTFELITQIIACIEATIPFRSFSPAGKTVSEQIYQRLLNITQVFQLGLNDETLRETVQRGVRVANRDVGSFGGSSAYFLDNTWSLLPETNHGLTGSHVYSIRQYRTALQKMADFLEWLKPELIFRQFEGEPTDRIYQMLLDRASHNLQVGHLYLRSKLLSIAILEGIALNIGKDVPLAMLVGTAPSPGKPTAQLEDFLSLHEENYCPVNQIEQEVLDLLEQGRNQTTAFDIKNSPFTTLLVKCIGFEEVRKLANPTRQFFEGKLSGDDFLAHCNPAVVQSIVDSLLKLLESRQAILSNALTMNSNRK